MCSVQYIYIRVNIYKRLYVRLEYDFSYLKANKKKKKRRREKKGKKRGKRRESLRRYIERSWTTTLAKYRVIVGSRMVAKYVRRVWWRVLLMVVPVPGTSWVTNSLSSPIKRRRERVERKGKRFRKRGERERERVAFHKWTSDRCR